MEELLSPPVVFSGFSAATVLFGSALMYLEGLFGSDDDE